VSSSIPSSTSSSSGSSPTVTVVIGASAPPESLEACLTALETQLDDGVEVRVHEAGRSGLSLRERFSWATFVEAPGAVVPLLWRDGIDAARTEIVALTVAQMIPATDWVARIRTLQANYDAVGGAIEAGPRLRAVDWAEYFCRYSRDMPPFSGRESLDLPGDNAAYKRHSLESVTDSYRHGFWEPFVHQRLARNGVVHWQDPELVVRMTRSAGFRAFTTQRRSHGRQYGRDRGAAYSSGRRVVGVLATPVVPVLMTARVLRRVFAKRRYRLRALSVLPLILWFNLAWAIAEARGYLDLLRS
jgi:hypothetical protein